MAVEASVQPSSPPAATGWTLAAYLEQTRALTKKNFAIQRRSVLATAAQLGVGIFFLLLLTVLKWSVDALNAQNGQFADDRAPPVWDVGPPPRCVVGGVGGDCYTFVYTPDTADTRAIIDLVLAASALPAHDATATGGEPFGARPFADEAAINDYLVANPNTTQAAVIFRKVSDWASPTNSFAYDLQLNMTRVCNELGVLDCTEPTRDLYVPMQAALDQAFLRVYGDTADASIDVSFSNFPHPDLEFNFDVMQNYGASFLFIAMMFNFVIQGCQVVQEKEGRLRMALRQIGMLDSAYWTSWYICLISTNTVMTILMVISGWILGFDFFSENAFGLYVFLFWLTTLSFTGFACLFSTITGKTATMRSIGILLFIVGFIAAPILIAFIFNSPKEKWETYRGMMGLVTPFLFMKGATDLIGASSGETALGMKWEERNADTLPETEFGEETFWSFSSTLNSLLFTFILYAALAVFLDKTLPNEFGWSKEKFYFLCDPRSLLGKGKTKAAATAAMFEVSDSLEEDVKTEAAMVLANELGDTRKAIVVRGLKKEFKSRSWCGWKPWKCGCCCKKENRGACCTTSVHNAVDGIAYSVDEDTVFALLGHNGAGKSTTINLLTGLMPISGGDATISGHSVEHEMNRISQIMGVCPQHDILWEQLTGKEHIELFARIKATQGSTVDVEEEIRMRLKDVLLDNDGDARAGAYSGGMKRRLSVALALVGNPRVVFFDEPTTGMDPVTRADVWAMIERVKQGRCIVLTTHSMEETDVLADRVSVMADGQLIALGTSLHLKNKFGSGLRLSLFAPVASHPEVTAFVQGIWKIHLGNEDMQLLSQADDALLFQLPRVDDLSKLVPFFEAIEAARDKGELEVSNVSIGLSTMEDVFLELSNRNDAAVKAASTTSAPDAATEPSGTEADLFKIDKTRVAPKGAKLVKAQVDAVFRKSLTYQKRQPGQCCFLVGFPIVIFWLLGLLESGVFAVFRQDIVCGEDEPRTTCAITGPNLECAALAYKTTYAFEQTLAVGVIGALNRNCEERGKCYQGLERPDWVIPTYSAAGAGSGSLTATANPILERWYTDLLWKAHNTTCDSIVSTAIDCFDADDPERVYTPDEEKKCVELEVADAWRESNAGVVGASANLGTCAAGAQSTGSGPPAAIMDELAVIRAQADTCRDSVFDTVLSHFSDESLVGYGLAPILSTTVDAITPISTGVLGKLSTAGMPDSIFASFESNLVMKMVAGGIANMPSSVSSIIVLLAAAGWGLAEMTPKIIGGELDVKSMCLTTGAAGEGHLQTFMGTDLGVSGTNLGANLCAFSKNLDKIRALHTMSYASKTAMDEMLYADWGGTRIQTPNMAAGGYTGKSEYLLRYKNSFYDVKWGAFGINAASNGQYDYTAYFNLTGAADLDFMGGSADVIGALNRYGNWGMLSNLMDTAIMKEHVAGTDVGISVRQKTFPRSFKCNRDEWAADTTGEVSLECDLIPAILAQSINDYLASIFMPYMLQLFMFVVCSLIVYEKESGLREMMKMMGLGSFSYWLVNYFFYLVQYIGICIVMSVMAGSAGMRFFTLHSPFVTWGFLLVWGNTMTAFSMLLSLFFKSSRTSTVVILLYMLMCTEVGGPIIGQLIGNPAATENMYTPLMFFPNCVMIRMLYWIAFAAGRGEEMTWENWGSFGNGVMPYCFMILIVQWFVSIFLLWWLEQVMGGSASSGVKREPLFCCRRRFWDEKLRKIPDGTSAKVADFATAKEAVADSTQPLLAADALPADVLDEHNRVLASDAVDIEVGTDSKQLLARLLAMSKTYPSVGEAPEKIAVQMVSLGLEKQTCFGLLGQNGAGKTTIISMLTGLFEPTKGSAFIDGKSIKHDMAAIQQGMGVCPQHDHLYDDLTAREHLLFYGRLKGFSGKALKDMVDGALKAVNLDDDPEASGAGGGGNTTSKRVKTFSGGMKRRLSVACSLMGNPTLVYMDEPSTGLDPASRRKLWGIISEGKKGRCIVLTTHSMEEADVLCDRIGIMAHGLMQCIGTASSLKLRFGAGYTLTITSDDKSPEMAAKVEAMLQEALPEKGASRKLGDTLNGCSKFELQRELVKLSTVFASLESNKALLNISDWGIEETTLEEVFLHLCEHPIAVMAVADAPAHPSAP